MSERELPAEALAEIAKETNEGVANREEHEGALNAVLENLHGAGYFREGEKAKLVFPDEETVEMWNGAGGKWPEGAGKAVARCEASVLIAAPNDPEWKKRFPSTDALSDALAARGYRVDAWTGETNDEFETVVVAYCLYEQPE